MHDLCHYTSYGKFNAWYLWLAGFLDLTLDDVGAFIELVYTPVCKDGTKGSPKNVASNIISPGKFFLRMKLEI
jgi:hypothetical protein